MALYYIIYIQLIYADDTQLVVGFHPELIGWAFEKVGGQVEECSSIVEKRPFWGQNRDELFEFADHVYHCP